MPRFHLRSSGRYRQFLRKIVGNPTPSPQAYALVADLITSFRTSKISGTCPLVKASLSRRQPSMTRFARLKGKRCRDSEPSPEKLSGTAPFFRCAPGWLRSDPTIFPTNHRDSTLLCPRPHRGEYRLRYLQ